MMENKNIGAPRILIAAPKSGSGKTTVACGILELLKRRGLRLMALKCGPDYIDPMFHRSVLGIPTGNIDTFFTDPDVTSALLRKEIKGCDLAVLEAAMGYFDGLGGTSTRGSAWEIAETTGTPTILVLDAKGGSVSMAALIQGFLTFDAVDHSGVQKTDMATAELEATSKAHAGKKSFSFNNRIRGIFLNRVSRGYYPRLKQVIESRCGIPVIGYLPDDSSLQVPSRHLGLVDPDELPSFRNWVSRIADLLEETLDTDMLLKLADLREDTKNDAAIDDRRHEDEEFSDFANRGVDHSGRKTASCIRIAIARDAAFSFRYTENELLLSELGAELVYFSPMQDPHLPPGIAGLILGGGYPERFAGELSDNTSMREEIREKVIGGLPTLAECGGFLYLQNNLEGADGRSYEMCGVFLDSGFRTPALRRFGYLTAQTRIDGIFGPAGTILKGHEFHHWDCTKNGEGLSLAKPMAEASERACIYTETLCAGFPHFYYPSNPKAAERFVEKCGEYQAKSERRGYPCIGY